MDRKQFLMTIFMVMLSTQLLAQTQSCEQGGIFSNFFKQSQSNPGIQSKGFNVDQGLPSRRVTRRGCTDPRNEQRIKGKVKEIIERYHGVKNASHISVVIYDGQHREMYSAYSKNTNTKAYLASTTKISAANFILENWKNIPDFIEIDNHAHRGREWFNDSTKLPSNVKVMSKYELYVRMMLHSNNQATYTLMRAASRQNSANNSSQGRSNERFQGQYLTEMAARYNESGTKFFNAHGLGENGNHNYSTAKNYGDLMAKYSEKGLQRFSNQIYNIFYHNFYKGTQNRINQLLHELKNPRLTPMQQDALTKELNWLQGRMKDYASKLNIGYGYWFKHQLGKNGYTSKAGKTWVANREIAGTECSFSLSIMKAASSGDFQNVTRALIEEIGKVLP